MENIIISNLHRFLDFYLNREGQNWPFYDFIKLKKIHKNRSAAPGRQALSIKKPIGTDSERSGAISQGRAVKWRVGERVPVGPPAVWRSMIACFEASNDCLLRSKQSLLASNHTQHVFLDKT